MPFLKDPNAIFYHPGVCTFGPNNHSLQFLNYHYIRYADGSEELYDLNDDPHEWHNLVGQQTHAKRIADYRQKLPKVNVAPIPTKWWNRRGIADWENAERNAMKRTEQNKWLPFSDAQHFQNNKCSWRFSFFATCLLC